MSKTKKTDIKLIVAIVILGLCYLAMLIGLNIDDVHADFIAYIPILYIVTFVFLLAFHKGWSINFLFFTAITILGIFLIQVINVKTGLVYGELKYGNTLGIKVLGVPLLATFNRFILIYCVGILVVQFKISYNLISSLTGALIIVFINLLAEPIAISLKYRAWAEHMSPLHNYGLRFITAFAFLYLFNSIDFPKKNKMYLPVLLMEIGFLMVLNMIQFG